MRPLIAMLLIAGCEPENQFPGATAVGNPGTTQLQTRQTHEPTLLSGSGVLVALDVRGCESDPPPVQVEQEVDLLDGGPFTVPGGEWCSVGVVFDGPLLYTGIREPGLADGTLELILDVGTVTIPLGSELFVDTTAFVIELGHDDWLDEEFLGPLEGRHTVVDAAHPAYEEVVGSIRDGSALFVDRDRDGLVDDSERATPAGAGPEWSSGEDD